MVQNNHIEDCNSWRSALQIGESEISSPLPFHSKLFISRAYVRRPKGRKTCERNSKAGARA